MNIFQTRVEQRKKVLNLKKIYDLDKAIAKIVDHADKMSRDKVHNDADSLLMALVYKMH